MEISQQELNGLLESERFGAKQEASATFASAVPLIYRAVADQPKLTGIPSIDAVASAVAPLVASSLFGVQNFKLPPTMAPGMSPFEAYYGRDVNTPLNKAMQDQFNWQMGANVGGTLGDIGNAMGLGGALGMSPQAFRQSMVNMGQSVPGQILADQLMRTGPMQTIMGGDVQGMRETMFANRHALGVAPGAIVSPMDIMGQTAITQHASNLQQSLDQAIYGGGVTPDKNFTRGFRPEEIGGIAATMAQRGADVTGPGGEVIPQGMRGMDTPLSTKTQAIGEMTRSLEALKELMGGGTIQELFRTLESLTQGQWPRINPAQLERTFREMSASANVLGVSHQQIMDLTRTAQMGMQGVMGITPDQAAMGITAGGYTDGRLAKDLATQVQVVANLTGQPAEQVMARQIGLQQMIMNSPRGQDIQHIAWLGQQGAVSGDMVQQFMSANQFGDQEQSRIIANRIFEQQYGNAAIGRAISRDPTQLQMMKAETGTPWAGWAMNQGMTVSDREILDRMGQNTERRMLSTSRALNRRSGNMGTLSPEQEASIGMEAIESVLSKAPEGGRLLAEVQDVYQRSFAANPDAQSAMRSVNKFMQGEEFTPYRKDIRRERRMMSMEASEEQVLSPQGEDQTRITAGVAAWARAADKDENLMAVRDQLMDMQRQRQRAQRSGDVVGAEAINTEMMEIYNATNTAIEKTSPALYAITMNEEQRAIQARNNIIGIRGSQEAVKQSTDAAIQQGIGVGPVIDEAQILNNLFQGGPGNIAPAEAAQMIQAMQTLTPAQQAQFTEAYSAGPGTEQFAGAQEAAGRKLVAMQETLSRTSSERGITDLGGALRDLQSARRMLPSVKQAVGVETDTESTVDEPKGLIRGTLEWLTAGGQRGREGAPSWRETVYGKEKHPQPATPEKLAKQQEEADNAQKGSRRSERLDVELRGTLVMVDKSGNIVAKSDDLRGE